MSTSRQNDSYFGKPEAVFAQPLRTLTKSWRGWALLIPLLFLVAHGQFSFTQIGRNVEGSGSLASVDATAGSADDALIRCLVYLSYGIVLYQCVSAARHVERLMWRSKPIIGLVLLAVSSTLWSQQSLLSFRSAIYYGLDTLLGIYLVSAFALEDIMTLMMMTGVAVSGFSLVMIIFFPEYGIVQGSVHHGVWQGIFADENDAGKNLAFLLTPVLNHRIFRWTNVLYAGMLLSLIYKTGSKTALVTVLVMVAFVLGRALIKKLHPKTAKFVMMVAGSFLIASLIFVFEAWTQVSTFLGRDPTLTGRTDIWTLLIQSAEAKPLLGYGYAAFWTGMDGESGKVYQAVHWIFTYAHNGFLDVWLQLGFVGVGLILYAIAQATRNALRCGGRYATPGTKWLTTVLFLTVMYNLDEGTLLFSRTLVSVLFVVVCVGLSNAVKAQRVHSIHWARRSPRFIPGTVTHA